MRGPWYDDLVDFMIFFDIIMLIINFNSNNHVNI